MEDVSRHSTQEEAVDGVRTPGKETAMRVRVADLRVRSVRTSHLWVEKWWTKSPEAGGKGGGGGARRRLGLCWDRKLWGSGAQPERRHPSTLTSCSDLIAFPRWNISRVRGQGSSSSCLGSATEMSLEQIANLASRETLRLGGV